MKTEFTNIMHRADMPNKFAGAPWSQHSHFLEKSPVLLHKTNRKAEEMEERARKIRGGGKELMEFSQSSP